MDNDFFHEILKAFAWQVYTLIENVAIFYQTKTFRILQSFY